MENPNYHSAGLASTITARVADIDRALNIVHASPYSKPAVTGGQSLVTLPVNSSFLPEKTLSVNEKLQMLENSGQNGGLRSQLGSSRK